MGIRLPMQAIGSGSESKTKVDFEPRKKGG